MGDNLKTEWLEKTIGEVCTLKSGTTINPKLEKNVGEIPYIKVADMNYLGNEIYITGSSRFLDKKDIGTGNFFPPGTTIFPKRGGAIATNKKRITVVPIYADLNIMGVIPSEILDPKFLYYFFLNTDLRLLGSGSSIPQLNNYDIAPLKILIPKIDEQQRIVHILDEAFEAIAIIKANTEKNLQNTRDLYASQLYKIFTRHDECWMDTTIDKISTNLDSRRIPITKGDRKKGQYPYYGASGIVDYVADFIFEDPTLLISEDGANLLARTTPIAFSVSGKYWVNNHAHILKFENMTTQRFVEYYFNSIKIDEYITGAAQPKLNQAAMNSIPIPLPKTISEQKKIVDCIDLLVIETNRIKAIYQEKIEALEVLKKSLLHSAFNDQL